MRNFNQHRPDDEPDDSAKAFVGLCSSCLGTGFVHAVRNGTLGVVFDKRANRIARCACFAGQAIDIRFAEDKRQKGRDR
ncbi:MAG: hypothetical protein MSG64_19875 [Pyrinomonadaceae bacterium MAG19_C2-C3]|nr:hypothetical protein [Pyrinomonadaceae bacterium MAG19_C2-C3]